ncbi:hypothetical protein CPAV1605_1449 [seawater metagenome]|uniref:2-cysteine adaptor domain-containing protein n=1 Tax=seawater metagenome TaxID=1561972 RepID=A0A5E8CLA8_9ZZZZ
MSLYKNVPVTLEELKIWRQKKSVNPRTNRKIKTSSPIYKYLKEEYQKKVNLGEIEEDIVIEEEEDNSSTSSSSLDDLKDISEDEIYLLVKEHQGPLNSDYTQSFDNKDPISQEDIWIMEKDQRKQSSEIPIYKMFSYRDNESNIRCFNIESIKNMIDNNISTHPLTNDKIDDSVFERGKLMIKILEENKILIKEEENDELNETKIKNLAFDVFQMFNFISVFVDSSCFLNLKIDKLFKLNYELKDFYENNVSIADRSIMVPPDGKVFTKTSEKLKNDFDGNKLQIQKYILENIAKVIGSSEDPSLKNLGNYLMIGGLAVICPEIRERYPDFAYSFSV